MRATVSNIVYETQCSVTIVCKLLENETPIKFMAGQYASFQFPTAPPDIQQQSRCFSFSAPNRDPRTFQFTVCHKPNGLVSSWLLESLKVGDLVVCRHIRGKFTVKKQAKVCLMLASGSGITPIKCIIEALLLQHANHQIRLFYAAKNVQEMIFLSQIKAWASKYPEKLHVQYHDYAAQGFPTTQDIKHFIQPFQADQVFLCGSEHFTKTVQSIDCTDITCELFQSTPVPTKQPDIKHCDASIHITLHQQQHHIQTNNKQSILSILKDAGLEPHYSCEAGFCGTCITKLTKGSVHAHTHGCLSDEEVKAGYRLSCQCYPSSDHITLDFDAAQQGIQAKTSTLAHIQHAYHRHQDQWIIAIVGLCLIAIPIIIAWQSPSHFHLLNPGPMIQGHATLACTACHTQAPGNMRQQIQAKVQFLLGNRQTDAHLFLNTVSNKDCLACHQRTNDRHPVYRFKEPRFVDALPIVDARYCVNCHQEHQGKLFTQQPSLCIACHKTLKIKHDPLDIAHTQIIAQKRWSTCLECHDFHGNHQRKVQQVFQQRYATGAIQSYLNHGSDPYAPKKIVEAKKERQ